VGLWKPSGPVYILDIIRKRVEFPILLRMVEQEARKWRALTLVEDTGAGTSLLQSLPSDLARVPMRPHADKVVRLQAVSPRIEGRQVYLPRHAPWLDPFKRELLSFPQSAHDDQVDAFTQLLSWAFNHYHGPLQSRYSST
jgi:predicted phage terminase large subunit-like protein